MQHIYNKASRRAWKAVRWKWKYAIWVCAVSVSHPFCEKAFVFSLPICETALETALSCEPPMQASSVSEWSWYVFSTRWLWIHEFMSFSNWSHVKLLTYRLETSNININNAQNNTNNNINHRNHTTTQRHNRDPNGHRRTTEAHQRAETTNRRPHGLRRVGLPKRGNHNGVTSGAPGGLTG